MMNDESISIEWLQWFKRETESRWAQKTDGTIQQGTKWAPGLDAEGIKAYERDLGFEFSPELRLLLSQMNGFDRHGTRVRYRGSEPVLIETPVCYRYPNDLEAIHYRRNLLREDADQILKYVEVEIEDFDRLVPIFVHRYYLCPPNRGVVLSIHGDDSIIYGWNLKDYFEKEFLGKPFHP